MERFTDNHDETITDNKTGLIWMKDANYLRRRKSWKEAIGACKELGTGWRLPTIQELLSLIDYLQFELALPQGHPFINVQSSWYWSATTYASNTSRAWVVYLSHGCVDFDHKIYNGDVWPVKGKKKC